tara:strand:+ start:788 stop:889 length:102 start_codon:yes stop_codon:yes gene_type:complete
MKYEIEIEEKVQDEYEKFMEKLVLNPIDYGEKC